MDVICAPMRLFCKHASSDRLRRLCVPTNLSLRLNWYWQTPLCDISDWDIEPQQELYVIKTGTSKHSEAG